MATGTASQPAGGATASSNAIFTGRAVGFAASWAAWCRITHPAARTPTRQASTNSTACAAARATTNIPASPAAARAASHPSARLATSSAAAIRTTVACVASQASFGSAARLVASTRTRPSVPTTSVTAFAAA
eukprot:2918722-Prymnesium_polylepis.1